MTLEDNILFGKFLSRFTRFLGICYVLPKGPANTGGKPNKEETPTTTTTSASVTTMSEGANAETTDHSLPTHAAPPSTTTTATSLSLPTFNTVATSPTEKYPVIGWIYRLNIVALQCEMAKYGLSDCGTVEDLRKRFKEFLRSPAGQSMTSRGPGELPGGGDLDPYRERSDNREEDDDPYGLKEMLGLPPSADAMTVKRALSSIIRSSRGEGEERIRQDYEPPQTRPAQSMIPRSHPLMTARFDGDRRGAMPEQGWRPSDIYHPEYDHRPSTREQNDTVTICNLVRKWNLHFDGRKDPVSFVERLEELMESYNISGANILRALPELFHGNALLWQRNCRQMWNNYNDFRREFELQFFPPGYQRKLDDELRRRTQGERESFRDFVIAISTLMRRRGGLFPHEKLDILYCNMRPEYKLTVRRDEIRSTSDLITRAEHFESYLRDKANFQPPPNPAQALISETAYLAGRKGNRPIETQLVEPWGRPVPPKISEPIITFPPEPKRNGYCRDSGATPAPRAREDLRPARNSRMGRQGAVCWNCEEEGHISRYCIRPKTIRCFNCKTKGVLTTKCPCRSENFYGAQTSGGPLSPQNRTEKPPPTSGRSDNTK